MRSTESVTQEGGAEIRASLPGLPLTACQDAAIGRLQAFLGSPSAGIFLLKGYAGTGKTTLIRGVAAALSAAHAPFRLLAPTGRAARVIRQRTGFEASTIHRTIYKLDAVRTELPVGDRASDLARFVFELAANTGEAGTVYVVDEASMVSDTFQASESLRFGSGRLLSDLIAYVRPQDRAFGAKLVFVGDPAQLPPVGSSFSPALDADYLGKITGLEVGECELTTVVRQETAGAILANASALREGLRHRVFGGLDIRPGPDVLEIAVGDVPGTCLTDGTVPDPETVIIAHSNERVRDYNRTIRQRLFPGGNILETGDRLLVVANSYLLGAPIYNGDMAEVMAVDPQAYSPAKQVFVNAGRDDRGNVRNVFVPLTFRKVALKLGAGTPDERVIETFVIENLLHSPEGDLTPLETKALFVDFRNRMSCLRPGTAEFKAALATDPWFNALRVKHGYAMTCHKAQGGEWRRAIVDFRCSFNCFSSDYFRWAYTALTRARETLFALYPPHHAPDRPVRAAGQALPDRPDVLEVNAGKAMDYRLPGSATEDQFLRALHYVLALRAGAARLKLAHVAANPWLETVAVENEWREKGKVRINYNAARRVTRVDVDARMPVRLRDVALAAFGDLADRTLVITGAKSEQGVGVEAPLLQGAPWLQRFDQAVRSTVAPAGALLAAAETLSPYQYRYRFRKDGHTAVLMFYFNGKGVLTACVPVPGMTTSADLAGCLLDLVNRRAGGASDAGGEQAP